MKPAINKKRPEKGRYININSAIGLALILLYYFKIANTAFNATATPSINTMLAIHEK